MGGAALVLAGAVLALGFLGFLFLARRARFRPLLMLLRLLASSRAVRLADWLAQVAVALLLLRSR